MPKPTEPFKFGPFRGLNNIEDELSYKYAPSEEGQFVREASNVDLTRDGWFRSRVGRTKLLTLTNGHSLTAVGGMLLGVDGGVLKRFYPTETGADTATLVSGVGDSDMCFADIVGGDIFYCNGEVQGRISGGVATYWGLRSPTPPTLAATTGNLPAGEYLVALTCEGADGIEGGARKATKITLTSTGGIAVSGIAADANAAYTNLYLTKTNGRDLFWAARIDAATTSHALVDLPQSADLLRGMQMYPPPAAATFVQNFKGRLLVVAGNALYWSQPFAPHLFKLATDVQLFAEPPVLLAVVDDGFYLAEGSRTWWVNGTGDPDSWQPFEVDSAQVAACRPLRVPGRKIAGVETNRMVVVWASIDGPVVGQPGGLLLHPFTEAVTIQPHSKATLAFREEDGLSQILMNLQRRSGSSRFGASDRATCSVIKANLASN